MNLLNIFTFQASDFPAHVDECSILEGPNAVQMNRGSVGTQWRVQRQLHCFNVAIEDGHPDTLADALDVVSRLPPQYLCGLEIVSGAGENGMALYVDLGGASGHGSESYCNVVRASVPLVLHELGHAIQQRASRADATFLQRWKDEAVDVDAQPVSGYGNVNHWEDLAEFALAYAIAMMQRRLAELATLSPNRHRLWSQCLEQCNGALRECGCTPCVTLGGSLGSLGLLLVPFEKEPAVEAHVQDALGSSLIGAPTMPTTATTAELLSAAFGVRSDGGGEELDATLDAVRKLPVDSTATIDGSVLAQAGHVTFGLLRTASNLVATNDALLAAETSADDPPWRRPVSWSPTVVGLVAVGVVVLILLLLRSRWQRGRAAE